MFNSDSFAKTKERYNAWWERELIDRALVQVYAPIKTKKNLLKDYKELVLESYFSFRTIKKWKEMDFDNTYLISSIKEAISSVYFAGDAFPHFWVNLGPGSIAAYLGCNAEFREDTVWFGPPVLKDYKEIKNISLNEEEPMWKITQKLTKDAIEKSNGDYFVSSADLGMGLDIFAHLRGAQNLIFDLIECPEEVKKFTKILSDKFITCFDRLYDIVKDKQEFFFSWLPVYCDGKNYAIHCDFSALISPEMFEEFAVPYLAEISGKLDRSIYHLDGPDAVKHLDILLDIKEIDAIQWVPGDGTPSAIHWIPMLKKIQARNKALYLFAEDTSEVEKLMEELEPEGLLIRAIVESEEEADFIVKKVEKLTVKS